MWPQRPCCQPMLMERLPFRIKDSQDWHHQSTVRKWCRRNTWHTTRFEIRWCIYVFNSSGRTFANISNSINNLEAVNLRQLNGVKRYIKKISKIVTILNIRVKKIISALYKLLRDTAHHSVKADIITEARSLIRKIDDTRSSEEYD